jgi:hypothetical protein
MIIRRTGKLDDYGRMIKFQSAVDAGLVNLNYWGDGSNGDLNTSANVTLSSTQDGDMIVRNYRNLTVNSGHTLTVQNRCRGLLLFVAGDLTVNGIISMSARGCKANPAESTTSSYTPEAPGDGNAVDSGGIQLTFKKDGQTDSGSANLSGCGSEAYNLNSKFPVLDSDGVKIAIARIGAAGGLGAYTSGASYVAGDDGSAGGTGQSGGGGGGATYGGTTVRAGSGTAGTCFSGGSAGGGTMNGAQTAYSGVPYGGAGGRGNANAQTAGGGAGNPGGDGSAGGSAGESGTGGLLIIVVSGSVTIGSGGMIEAGGKDGGAASTGAAGGASGGGNIVLVHAGTLSNNGSITTPGGIGGDGYSTADGGDGGAGSVQILQVDN